MFEPVCHQNPEKSFSFLGSQMAGNTICYCLLFVSLSCWTTYFSCLFLCSAWCIFSSRSLIASGPKRPPFNSLQSLLMKARVNVHSLFERGVQLHFLKLVWTLFNRTF